MWLSVLRRTELVNKSPTGSTRNGHEPIVISAPRYSKPIGTDTFGANVNRSVRKGVVTLAQFTGNKK